MVGAAVVVGTGVGGYVPRYSLDRHDEVGTEVGVGVWVEVGVGVTYRGILWTGMMR